MADVLPITAEQVRQKLLDGEKLQIVDVRSLDAYQAWHLPGSVSHPATEFASWSNSIAKSPTPILICNRGQNSWNVGQELAALGIPSFVLQGGLKEWNRLYEPRPIAGNSPNQISVIQIARLGKGCLSYAIVSKDRTTVLLDIGANESAYNKIIAENKLKVVGIVDTHIHADHLSGGPVLASQLGVPYLLPQASQLNIPFQPIEKQLEQLFPATIKVISTPGHTTESVSILIDDYWLFVGDVLFETTVGRSDLGQELAGNARILYDSVKSKLFALSDKVVVCPTHTHDSLLPGGTAITFQLSRAKRGNDIVRFQTADEFAKFVSGHPIATPANFETIKQINKGILSVSSDPDELELGANRCAVSLSEHA